MTGRAAALLVAVNLAAGAALAQPASTRSGGDVALLQGLDKVTARISSFEAPIGSLVRFGTLRIVVRYCRTRPPEEPPETAAFLEVREERKGEGTADLFSGWMFASSPALSSLEHPVYDVWVVGCRTASTASNETSR